MKELKDIVLKKGDIVYYINPCGAKSMLCVDGYDGSSVKEIVENGWVITKVERPTQYKTIYEAPKQILDKEEKEYLEAVIRPFRDKVVSISKYNNLIGKKEFITIAFQENEFVNFPFFKTNTMYKGMELNKEYTLDELGLFKR